MTAASAYANMLPFHLQLLVAKSIVPDSADTFMLRDVSRLPQCHSVFLNLVSHHKCISRYSDAGPRHALAWITHFVGEYPERCKRWVHKLDAGHKVHPSSLLVLAREQKNPVALNWLEANFHERVN